MRFLSNINEDGVLEIGIEIIVQYINSFQSQLYIISNIFQYRQIALEYKMHSSYVCI